MSSGFKISTLVKTLVSFSFLTGTAMTLMGLGVIDVDPVLDAVAHIYIEPLGIDIQFFMGFLGTCKILGVLSLWGYGPMPRPLAFVGLSTSALCAVYGHYRLNDGMFPFPLMYATMMGLLFFLERQEQTNKKDTNKKD